jgi:hydroxymethylbilane synthase
MLDKIRIGTRASRLALTQAELVRESLAKANNLDLAQIEIVPMITTGDKIQDRNLSEIGGKGLFTKEIEEALIAGSIDLAVHSMKDMPAILPENLEISAILEREDPRDALIANDASSISQLPLNSIIGSSSSRRKSQLLHLRPDLNIINFRGNIDTRLIKLTNKQVNATLLAVSGLKRLNFDQNLYHIISDEEMLPAVAQGAIGIESKVGCKIKHLIDKINHVDSEICIKAERGFLEGLGASCATPIAALAEIKDDRIYLRCLIAKRDGSIIKQTRRIGSISSAYVMGLDAAHELMGIVGKNFFD